MSESMFCSAAAQKCPVYLLGDQNVRSEKSKELQGKYQAVVTLCSNTDFTFIKKNVVLYILRVCDL